MSDPAIMKRRRQFDMAEAELLNLVNPEDYIRKQLVFAGFDLERKIEWYHDRVKGAIVFKQDTDMNMDQVLLNDDPQVLLNDDCLLKEPLSPFHHHLTLPKAQTVPLQERDTDTYRSDGTIKRKVRID